MSRGIAGPFRCERFSADGIISTKPVWFGGYTATNAGMVAVTMSFYDNSDGGSGGLIEQVVVQPNVSLAIYPNGDTLNGMAVKCSNWASVGVGVRWAPR